MTITPSEAKAELLKRSVRDSVVSWAKYLGGKKGWLPAKHHTLLLEKLQAVCDGTLKHSKTGKPCRNLIVSMPRGSAKSTYSSVIFPPWAIQKRRQLLGHPVNLLACSHTAELIENFSGHCISTIDNESGLLGYGMNTSKRGVSKWATNKGDEYLARGVGAGVVGFRGDIGIIDDYFGSHEDADSKTIRDKRWNWYLSDFWGCLKPDAIQIIVATRWHEEDLIGRLLDENNSYSSPVSSESWEVIRIPYIAEEGDCLGRQVGERLWADYYNADHEAGVRAMPPRIFAGMYQQRPAPEDGDYFKREWILKYDREEYEALEKKECRVYGAGDWAVSEEDDSNRSCGGGCKVDENKTIYILPDLFWGVHGPKELLAKYTQFLKNRNPLVFWSEKGHISKAWGPFLRDMMLEEDIYNHITEVTPSKAKDIRARAIQGLMSMGRVKFPSFASWLPDAEHEMLTFPGGKTDDFVDFIAHLGAGVISMMKHFPKAQPVPEVIGGPMQPITLTWIKESHKNRLRMGATKYAGR